MIKELLNEDVSLNEECNLCKEVDLEVGAKSYYGAVVICRVGDSFENTWLATLSPKTGGDVERDFTVQLMPLAHLTHFSQMGVYPGLAENYGVIFSKINEAMTKIMAMGWEEFKVSADTRETSVSVATYGKCTNWKEKKEHLHIKLFPFRGNIGQPYTVDSSFGRKVIYKEGEEEFIKMDPVRKVRLKDERFKELSSLFMELLK